MSVGNNEVMRKEAREPELELKESSRFTSGSLDIKIISPHLR